MGIKTRRKNLPASVVARYSGRQPNLKCDICNRTFSYNKNLQKHMTLHSDTTLELHDTNMFDLSTNNSSSLKRETELTESVNIQLPNGGDGRLPVSVKKVNGVVNRLEMNESKVVEMANNNLQNSISDNENGFPEGQLLEDSCADTGLEDPGSQSVCTGDTEASLAPTTVLTKENLLAATSMLLSVPPEVQVPLSNHPSPLLCDFCGRSFNNPGNFQQHRIMHTGERPLKCYYCKCSFSVHAEWKEHLASHSKTNMAEKQDKIHPISNSPMTLHSSLTASPCTTDTETVVMKLNLDLNDKSVTNDNTFTTTEIANVRSGRLEQLIEALTKEVAQSSVDIQGEKNQKGLYSNIPVNNTIKNLVIVQNNPVPVGSSNSNKDFTEKTVLSSKQYQCPFCPRSFRRASHLTNHEKIHTRGKQTPPNTSTLINRSLQEAALESRYDTKSTPVSSEILIVAQNTGQFLGTVSEQSHPSVRVHPVGQQWSCDVCSKQCINKSHLLQHQKIHAKRKRNNYLLPTPEPQPSATPEPQPSATPEPQPSATPEPQPSATPEPQPSTTPEPQPSATVLSSQEKTVNSSATITDSLQNLEANRMSVPNENACCICRKRLSPISKENAAYSSSPNTLCTACMHTNQISNKKHHPQTLASLKNTPILNTGYNLEKEIKKYQKRQSRKYKKSWFHISRLKLTKSTQTFQKLPFCCKLCKKKFPNKWNFHCHRQCHPGSKLTTFKLCDHIKYFFQWSKWLTTQVNHTYTCSHCDKSFKSFGGFCVHQRSHRTDFFVCKKCNLKFFLKNSLKYHSFKCSEESFLQFPVSGSIELDKLHSQERTEDSTKESKSTVNQKLDPQDAETSTIQWECNTCRDHFDQAIQLVQHYQAEHTESKPFQCPICKQLYNKTELALNHLSLHSTTNSNDKLISNSSNHQITYDSLSPNLNKNLFCNICEKNLPSMADLKTHLNSHSAVILPVQVKPTTNNANAMEKNPEQDFDVQHSKKVYLCEFCGKSFSNANKLQIHCRSHSGERPYQCPHCSKSFSLNDAYKRHVQTHTHSYQCRVCSRRYQTSSDLEHHQNESNHHLNASDKVSASKRGSSPYTYKCNICQKVVRNLKIHMRIHDPHPDTVYKCNVCPKTFLQSGNLKQHLMMHSGERPLRCEFCDKGFIHSSHLKRHRQTHTGERPHQCEYCQKRFAEHTKLRMHLRTHTKEKPYACHYKDCGKYFSLKSVLNAHLLLHTGERPHSCEDCGRTFTQRCNLIAHRRIHTGERPFKCKICQRAFRNSSNLKDHERLHSDDKPFKCHLCSKVFKRSYYLSKHLLIHSSEQNARNRGSGKNSRRMKVVGHGEEQQLEVPNSSTMATGARPKESYLPSESLQATKLISDSSHSIKEKVSSLAVTSIENVGFEQLIKTLVDPASDMSGSVLEGYTGCGTVENVIEIYAEQDSVTSQISTDNISELTSTMVNPQIVSTIQKANVLERYFQCHLCHKTFESSQMLNNHVLLHIPEKEESQADMEQWLEKEDSSERSSLVTVESPKEAQADRKKEVCESLLVGARERPVCQSASDEQDEISPKTLECLSELTYHLINYVKGELEFQLIGNGPNLHLNSIRQTLRLSDDDKIELGAKINATMVTFIEFQTQPEQSSSFVTSDLFACLLCLYSSPILDTFAEHVRKHFSEFGLTTASVETDSETDPHLLADSKKSQEIKDTDQDESCSQNTTVSSAAENIGPPIKQELILDPQSRLGTDSRKQNVVTLLTLDDGADADCLSDHACDPHNIVAASSCPEIQNTDHTDSGRVKMQSTSAADRYEDLVEKSNSRGSVKVENLTTNFFQDSNNGALGPKDNLHQGKASTANQSEELFTIVQKDLSLIDTAHQLSKDSDIKKIQCLPSISSMDSNSFEICLECKPGEKPFKCGICKKMFKKLKYVKDHIKLHIGKTSLVCEICGKNFQRAFNLKQHHKIHETKKNSEQQPALTEADPTKEPANQKTTNNEYSHNYQLTNKSNKNPLEVDKQLYTCDICSKTFQLQVYLKQHLKVHTSVKPYTCDYCEMSFSIKAYLTKHRRVHTGEKPYKCGYCDKGFARSELLTRHTRTHTKEKPYSCPHCSHAFALYNTLKRHLRTHTGQKPFECAVCGQAFTQRGNLSIHMRLHTGERPFKCDKCQAGFIHSSNLKKHLKCCS